MDDINQTDSLQFSLITLDYKLNFNEEKSEQIPELHQRVADRLYDLLTSNGGLYIKIGVFTFRTFVDYI